jgi:hypothetical protein
MDEDDFERSVKGLLGKAETGLLGPNSWHYNGGGGGGRNFTYVSL